MRISVDLHHNPLRGCVECTNCHTPLIHIPDDWHHFLAREAARKNGVEWTDEMVYKTPRAFYPTMIRRAAEMLCSRVRSQLFCQYCGKALQQPLVRDDDGGRVLPKPMGNNWKAIERWVQEIGLQALTLPLSDYHAWSGASFEQEKGAEPVMRTW